jgi:nitroreductase
MGMDTYEAIFKRKSIRKYDMTPLANDALSGIRTDIKILPHSEINSFMAVKAPHYVAISSEAKDLYLTNAGYLVQQIDLFLSSSGYGSCYLGMARPHDPVRAGLKYEFVILLAFGIAAEPLYRTKMHDFRRKTIDQINRITGISDLLEAARFAPSAVNSQPWLFTGTVNEIHAFCIKLNPISALVYEKVNKIDMGIALYHLKVAAEHFGKTSQFAFEAPPKDVTPAGHYFIATLKIIG